MHRNGSPLDNISTFSTTHTRKQPKPFIELAPKQHVVGREMIGVFMTLAFEKV